MSTEAEKERVIEALERKDFRILAEDASMDAMMELADEWAANRARLLKATDARGRLRVLVHDLGEDGVELYLDAEAAERDGVKPARCSEQEVQL